MENQVPNYNRRLSQESINNINFIQQCMNNGEYRSVCIANSNRVNVIDKVNANILRRRNKLQYLKQNRPQFNNNNNYY